MPQPPLSEQTAERLIALYEQAQARLTAGLMESLRAQQRGRSDRFRQLLRAVDAELDRLEEGTRSWLTSDLVRVYEAGGVAGAQAVGSEYAWSQIHRDAVEALVRQNWDEVLSHTRYVRRATKSVIRRLATDAAARTLLGEVTASRAGVELAAVVRRATGLATVRYSDGSLHSLADWSDMNARTMTALSFNEGTLNQATADGFEYMECFDGADCQLVTHNSGGLANGLVLPIAEARSYPIAHPRCARSWAPRQDITSKKEAREAARYSKAEQEAMAVAERERAAKQLVTGEKPGKFSVAREAGRTGRRPREPRTPRVARA